MTDIDKEQLAHKILDDVYEGNHHRFLYGDALDIAEFIIGYTEQRSLELLSRIKEEGPKDKKLKDGEGSMTSNTILIIQNEQNAKWRTTIDNIAKEIRGENE